MKNIEEKELEQILDIALKNDVPYFKDWGLFAERFVNIKKKNGKIVSFRFGKLKQE